MTNKTDDTTPGSITITLHGSYTARCGGLGLEARKERGSPISTLCRQLIAYGVDPTTPVKVTREGTLCFNPRPVSAWAAQNVEETPERSARFVPYRAFNPAKTMQAVVA